MRPSTQDRTTALLLLNNALGAATGVLFWLVLVRLAGIEAADVGTGYTVIALGTAIGLVAKGGMDTAIMRHVPRTDTLGGRRLLWRAMAAGTAVAALLAAASMLGDHVTHFLSLGGGAWMLVAAIAALLVVAWLQDSFCLAHGAPGATVARNAAFSAARLVLPLAVVLLALPEPVPLSWALALAVSAVAGALLVSRRRLAGGVPVPGRVFFRSARRNVAGNAAEFLPGLLLAPLVLAVAGAQDAGHFAMAWTAASLLFLAAAAIARSAFTQMVRRDPTSVPVAVRRGAAQAALLLVPASILAVAAARPVLLLFGQDYASTATPALMVLAASTLFVAPTYLYLSVLRAREATRGLIAFPVAMVAVLAVLAPVLALTHGLTGVAVAWLAANLPAGLWAAHRLHRIGKEVDPVAPTANVRGGPHTE